MINLWKFQESKKVKIVDIEDTEYIGFVVDITDSEEFVNDINEDAITIEIDQKHIEFAQSEIKYIEEMA